MKGRGFSRLLGNIVVGIIGAVLGGFLFGRLGIAAGRLLGALVTAVGGAAVLLFLISIIKQAWTAARRVYPVTRQGRWPPLGATGYAQP